MPNLTYIQHIVSKVNDVTARCGPIFIFGENINYGSRIGGLARGLTVNPEGRIQNVGNCELTHVGLGLGMLLDGGQAALFGKQLDFIVLGLEQACDTFNFIRAFRPKSTWGSFTIFVIVCDQGFQGPQSSMNAAGDFASLANIPVFCLNGAADCERVIANNFASPGFRVMCLSQRQFGMHPLEEALVWSAADDSLFQYQRGEHATIVSLNFALRDAMDIHGRLQGLGATADVFHMNFIPGMNVQPVLESCRRTGRLIVLDDSKTVTKFGDSLIVEALTHGVAAKVLTCYRRGCADEDYGAVADRFVPEFDRVLSFMNLAS